MCVCVCVGGGGGGGGWGGGGGEGCGSHMAVAKWILPSIIELTRQIEHQNGSRIWPFATRILQPPTDKVIVT